MALLGKFSIVLYIILLFIMIEKSTCVYEVTRDIRSPKPIRGILYICTEENMKRKVSTCILCKGPDLSCFSSSSSTTTSTTTTTTTKPPTSTTSTSTEPVVTTSSTTTKEPAEE